MGGGLCPPSIVEGVSQSNSWPNQINKSNQATRKDGGIQQKKGCNCSFQQKYGWKKPLRPGVLNSCKQQIRRNSNFGMKRTLGLNPKNETHRSRNILQWESREIFRDTWAVGCLRPRQQRCLAVAHVRCAWTHVQQPNSISRICEDDVCIAFHRPPYIAERLASIPAGLSLVDLSLNTWRGPTQVVGPCPSHWH